MYQWQLITTNSPNKRITNNHILELLGFVKNNLK
jgi:hypothetical protein